MSSEIASRLQDFDSTALSAAFKTAANYPDAIDLSVGFPEEPTPDSVKAAAIGAINANQTRYTPAAGLPELRQAIAQKLNEQNSIDVGSDEVAVTPGSTTAILLAYLATLNPGDEVLIPDPYFPPYRDLARMIGAKPVTVPTAPAFQLTARLLGRYITARTKALVINSPNNPSGAVYPKTELLKIANLARQHDLLVISDEAYEYFCYDEPHFSIGSVYENTLTLNSFSKSYGMTGWRVGYIAGPMVIIEAVNQLQQYIVFSSSTIGQYAALEAIQEAPVGLSDTYRAKRDLALAGLSEFFPRGIDGAQGSFFLFLKLPKGTTDNEFVERALKNNVLVLPGSAFSAQNDYIRLSYAPNISELKDGIERLNRTLRQCANH